MMTELTNNLGATLAFGMPGGTEWIILLVLGLLIFGRRLPEVGRSLGKGIVEFKKGIKGIEDEIDDASTTKTPPKLSETSSPRLQEQSPDSGVSQASAADESENPYRPADEPGNNG